MFPTGTSSVVSPIAADTVAKKFGTTTLTLAVIPDYQAEVYQLINTINMIAISTSPVIIINEDFSELVSEETKRRARLAAQGTPSNFVTDKQFSLELSCKLARLIGGLPENESMKTVKDDEDDFAFLDVDMESTRNQSVEIHNAFGGRQDLFVMHYSRSINNNFEELGILKPSIKPNCPGNPLAFVEYNSSTLSEEEVVNSLRTSFERQNLQAERMFLMASDHNELVVLIPTKIPARLKNLIKYVKKNRSLRDVLQKWARATLLSDVPPIRRGEEKKILKNGLEKIFFQSKSEVDDVATTQGFSMDLNELRERHLLFYLSHKEKTFLRPIRGGAE
jgi:hypothetical protein